MNLNISRVRHRFNIADFCIIIIVAAIIISLAIRFGVVSPGSESADRTIEYTLVAEGLDESYASYINVGDTIIFSGGNTPVGTVKEVSSTSYQPYISMGDATVRKTSIPQKITLELKIEVSCSFDETEGYKTSSGHSVITGNTEEYRNKFCSFKGMILDIKDQNIVSGD